jgi:alpha/beta hydrolase fold/WD40-like Beta Propeller Repeat
MTARASTIARFAVGIVATVVLVASSVGVGVGAQVGSAPVVGANTRGLHLTAEVPLGGLPSQSMYWHIYEFDSHAAAEAARPGRGVVAEVFGRHWLYVIAEEGWRNDAGRKVSVVADTRHASFSPYRAGDVAMRMWFSAAVVVLFGVRMLAQPAVGGSVLDMNLSSPDGRSVVFTSRRHGSVDIYRADGTGLKMLTSGSGNYGFPSWSPDGTRLVARSAGPGGGQGASDAPGVTTRGAVTHVYKSTESGDLRLHVFLPAGGHSNPRPAILFFFGGRWTTGGVEQFVPQAKYFAGRGIVAIVVDYRVFDRHATTPFEAMADAKSAIRWVRAHAAKLAVDPTRIVASGGSSGGTPRRQRRGVRSLRRTCRGLCHQLEA